MSSPYNHKINSDGTYRNFYGWSIISIALSDMKCIENFLNNSRVLNTFYSPLPSSSQNTIYDEYPVAQTPNFKTRDELFNDFFALFNFFKYMVQHERSYYYW